MVYEAQLRRYRDLLDGEHAWITQAMSWSVVIGGAPTVESVAGRLGGEPVCPFPMPTREPPHTPAPSYLVDELHARNALGDAWPATLQQMGRHL